MKNIIKRVVLIVLDSVGIGELPDAADYGDEGSNTLVHTALAVGGLKVPNMQKLGLGNIVPIAGIEPLKQPQGCYGKMAERSKGKDTTTGHWELAGIISETAFPTYPYGFPEELISQFEQKAGLKVLGNKVASGTEIIKELGEEHLRTGKPIIYTSADSVFQIAAHEEVIPPEKLYDICRIARELLKGEHAVGRVIARPFIGEPDNFARTANRHDFSLQPSGKTILDLLDEKGYFTAGIGKIGDIFAHRAVSISITTKNNQEGIEKTIGLLREEDKSGLIFANLVEFDSQFGHRNNPLGYAQLLEQFDQLLPDIIAELKIDDLLIITADHGCDPTTDSTDHSREYVPLLVYGEKIKQGTDLGIRSSFADVAATICELFDLPIIAGTSFVSQIIK